jgi:hypothetical protein
MWEFWLYSSGSWRGVLNMVKNLLVANIVEHFSTKWATLSFSRGHLLHRVAVCVSRGNLLNWTSTRAHHVTQLRIHSGTPVSWSAQNTVAHSYPHGKQIKINNPQLISNCGVWHVCGTVIHVRPTTRMIPTVERESKSGIMLLDLNVSCYFGLECFTAVALKRIVTNRGVAWLLTAWIRNGTDLFAMEITFTKNTWCTGSDLFYGVSSRSSFWSVGLCVSSGLLPGLIFSVLCRVYSVFWQTNSGTLL